MMSNLRLLNLLAQVRLKQPVDSVAVAIILTEMRFRGPFFRLCEIILAGLTIFIAHREPRLTLGTCQASFSIWRRHFGKDNQKLFTSLFDDLENYNVCVLFLSQHRGHSLEQALIQYNGRPSYLYTTLFHRNLKRVRAAISRLDESDRFLRSPLATGTPFLE